MQWTAQDSWYRENYPGAAFLVVEADGVPVGRLYLHRREREIRLVDIAILSAHRNARLGSRLLADLFAECEATRRTLTIHVEQFNPAMRWYQRLGFREIGEAGIYRLMEWRPRSLDGAAPTAPALS